MRATRISLGVIAAIMVGTTPVSSLDTPRKFARGEFVACMAPEIGAISLIGAHVGIALVSSHRCD